MAKKWSEVESSPTYQSLNDEEKGLLKQKYYNSVIVKSSSYTALKQDERTALTEKFFNRQAAQPAQSQAPETPGQRFGREFGPLVSGEFGDRSADLIVKGLKPVAGALQRGAEGAAEFGTAGGVAGVPLLMAKEAVPQTRGQAKLAMLGPLPGKVASTVAKIAVNPLQVNLTSGMKSILKLAEDKGIPMTVADITNSKMAAGLESFLAKTPFGSGTIQRFRERQIEAVRTAREALIKKFGPSEESEAIGIKLKEAIVSASREFSDKASALYSNIDSLVDPGARVPAFNLTTTANKFLDREKQVPKSLQNGDMIAILEDMVKFKDESFTNTRAIRSKFGELIRNNDAAIKAGMSGAKFQSNKQTGVYKQLQEAIEKDITEFSRTQNPKIREAFDLANSFYKQGKNTFDNKTIRMISKKNPERVVDFVFKPGAITEIEAVKKSVGEEGFRELKTKFVEKIMRSMEGQGQAFHPTKLARELGRYGDETLKRVFEPKELLEISELARVSERLMTAEKIAGNPSGTASNIIAAATYGGVGTGMFFKHPITGTAVLLGPKILAEAYVSPIGRRLLMSGIQISTRDQRAIGIAAQLTAYLKNMPVERPEQTVQNK